jgi:hypothetical protein
MGIGANSAADNGSYIPKSRAEQNRPGSNTAATGLFKEAANSPSECNPIIGIGFATKFF